VLPVPRGARASFFDCDLFAQVNLSFATFHVTRGWIETRVKLECMKYG